jgi:hypothetical protein
MDLGTDPVLRFWAGSIPVEMNADPKTLVFRPKYKPLPDPSPDPPTKEHVHVKSTKNCYANKFCNPNEFRHICFKFTYG